MKIQFPRTLKQTVSQTKRGKNVVLWFLLGFIRKEDKPNNQMLASNQRNAIFTTKCLEAEAEYKTNPRVLARKQKKVTKKLPQNSRI